MTSSGKNGLNMQVQNVTGPGVRRSKRPLLASRTPLQCSMETSRNLVIRSKLVIRSSSVIGSLIGVIFDELGVSLTRGQEKRTRKIYPFTDEKAQYV